MNDQKQEIEEFITACKDIANYWSKVDCDKDPSISSELERTQGVVFSILTLIDGCGDTVPINLSFEYDSKEGEVFNDKIQLHDVFYNGQS